MEKMERDEWFEKSYCLCCQVSSSGNTVAHVIGLEVVFLGLLWFLFLLAIDLLPLDIQKAVKLARIVEDFILLQVNRIVCIFKIDK
ncbi:uncharacterized protein [Elaeis guineensis]|uniref:uncharacterized protein isoform X2 n=1 Tax=Elaeis guineensis var. tenera TaxID=51953 RepID=UPI003C6D86D2